MALTPDVPKAVLLAAGRGTRLGSLTEHTPKPLLSVGGRPIIVRLLDALLSAGIRDVLIVTGYLGDRIEHELGNGAASGLRLRYSRQEHPEGTAHAVSLAKEFAGDERFFVGWADILVERPNYVKLIRSSRFADAALAVNEVEDPAAGAAVYVDGAMRVTRIVEKPAPGSSTTRWNNAGLCILPPAIWHFIEALQPSARGEYELPQAVAAFAESGAEVRAVPIEGPWFDVGTPADLEAARLAFGRERVR